MFASFLKKWNIIRYLTVRELAGQYAGSLFGYGWIIIQPVSFLLLYGFVFSIILKVQPSGTYEKIPFALWLLAGLIPWMFLTEAVSRAATSITFAEK